MFPDVSTNFSLVLSSSSKIPSLSVPISSQITDSHRLLFPASQNPISEFRLSNPLKMASEAEFSPETSMAFIEHHLATANRDISLLFPLILTINSASLPHESSTQAGRILLINPFVIDRNRHDRERSGRLPASQASIDALESVEIEKDDDHCVVCLDDWEIGEKARKMPCGHRFHGECVERWLRIRGSCPVCRYEMPVEESEDGDRKTGDGERSRGIWVGFRFGWVDPSDRNPSSGFADSDQEMQQA